jgi:hypothetical protein
MVSAGDAVWAPLGLRASLGNSISYSEISYGISGLRCNRRKLPQDYRVGLTGTYSQFELSVADMSRQF